MRIISKAKMEDLKTWKEESMGLVEEALNRPRTGPEQHLNDKDEEQTVTFIVGCSKIGYARSKKHMLALGPHFKGDILSSSA